MGASKGEVGGGDLNRCTLVSVRELLHSSSQTLTIMSQSARFACASAKGRAGNQKGRNKQRR